MKKTIFSDLNVSIGAYNGFRVLSNNESVARKNPKTKCIFPQIENQTEITILESGFYKIEYVENFNKNMKINIAPNANVIIYEDNTSSDLENLNNIEFLISENAKVELNSIDNFNKTYNNRYIDIQKNAKLKFNLISLTNNYQESKIVIDLNKENAYADFKLVTIADNESQTWFDVTINNNAKNTYGNIWQKGVSTNGGKIHFNASGFIKKDSDNAKNFQESRILLLDDASLGEASPNLLIDHYNVEAGHAASVSRVNDEELFYLQSRGLTKNEAEVLMTQAFISPLFDNIKSEDIREKFINTVFSRLGLNEL